MRMRKKKNLEKRFKNVEEYIIPIQKRNFSVEELIWLTHPCADESEFKSTKEYGKKPKMEHLDMQSIFSNNNPLHLEIGCGKGQFICQMAKMFPKINFLAVEMNQSVIVQACEKAKSANLTNVRFMLINANYLPIYIKPNSVEKIYLNFSTPFPKKSHQKHRLTHKNFLNIYLSILCQNGIIEQKTDNQGLFEFSICQFSQNNFKLLELSLDLHSSSIENNVITEYENKFSAQGCPIYYLKAEV